MWNIAHRGASGYAPENTRAAFDLAIAMGATAIETDVRMTTDGELILFHDATVDRVTNGRGPTDDYTLAEVQGLRVGGRSDEAGDRARVMTLRELLDEFAPCIPLVLEIKESRVTEPLVRTLQERSSVERVVVTSFLWHPLLAARERLPQLPLGFLASSFDDDILRRERRRGFQQICPHISQLTAKRVMLAHEHGLAVRAWGIEHRFQIDRLYETGADGATVNWPDWLAEAASSRA